MAFQFRSVKKLTLMDIMHKALCECNIKNLTCTHKQLHRVLLKSKLITLMP
jgi:hypothetical protein